MPGKLMLYLYRIYNTYYDINYGTYMCYTVHMRQAVLTTWYFPVVGDTRVFPLLCRFTEVQPALSSVQIKVISQTGMYTQAQISTLLSPSIRYIPRPNEPRTLKHEESGAVVT